jgi:hypothetical protein
VALIVGRLLGPDGIDLPARMSLPARLKAGQALTLAGDPRAKEIYQTLGFYLGYALGQLASVYDFRPGASPDARLRAPPSSANP